MKTRVVIISETIMDGVGKHIVDVIGHLDYSKIELTVIHSRNRLDYRFFDIKETFGDRVAYHEVPELIREVHPKLDLIAFKKVYKIIKTVKPDIVHCHSSKAGVVGRIAARLLHINKIYYTPHAYAVQNQTLSRKKFLLYLIAEKFLSKVATSLTLNVSEGERKFAIDHGMGTESQCKVLYNCVDEPTAYKNLDKHSEQSREIHLEMNRLYGIPENHLIVGTVARLYTQKNPIEFIEIAKAVCSLRQEVTFVWVGEGEQLDQMIRAVESANLLDRIKFVGHQKNIEKHQFWFDLYLTCALYEGLPYTLIEALCAKTPIVASNVIGNNELVIQNITGYLYELGHIEEATEKILALIDDHDKRSEMEATSYNLYKSHFTMKEMMSAYERLYLDVNN